MTTIDLAKAVKQALGEGNTLKAFALVDAVLEPPAAREKQATIEAKAAREGMPAPERPAAPAPEPAPERMTGRDRRPEAVIEDTGLHLRPGSHAADAPKVRK